MKLAFVTKHPWMKTFSVALAFFLWFVVHEEQHIESSLNVRIQINNIPDSLMIAGTVDELIHLRVAGPRTRVKNIDQRFFKPYVLDLSDARKGVNSFSVYEEDFSIPRGTRISRISPQIIRVNLDEAEERKISVEPRFVGMLEEGYELEKYEVTPPFLRIKGPRSELAGVRSFPTEPINLVGRHNQFSDMYAVRNIRPKWVVDQRKVNVSVKIREQNISRILENVPVYLPVGTKHFRVEPASVMLKIQGPAGRVKTVAQEEFSILLDKAEVLRRSKKVRKFLNYRLPEIEREGVRITLIPKVVQVYVKK